MLSHNLLRYLRLPFAELKHCYLRSRLRSESRRRGLCKPRGPALRANKTYFGKHALLSRRIVLFSQQNKLSFAYLSTVESALSLSHVHAHTSGRGCVVFQRAPMFTCPLEWIPQTLRQRLRCLSVYCLYSGDILRPISLPHAQQRC